jgi:hypothetical protein
MESAVEAFPVGYPKDRKLAARMVVKLARAEAWNLAPKHERHRRRVFSFPRSLVQALGDF